MRLLARREHSARELQRKLESRGHPAPEVEAELERLAAAGLQSDRRFAESYSEQRVERGDGPHKIRAALAERGIAGELIDAVLEPFADEWQRRAVAILRGRFPDAPASARERARRARFLGQRGFPAEVIQRATRDEVDE